MIDNLDKDEVFEDILESHPERIIELKHVTEFDKPEIILSEISGIEEGEFLVDAIYINLRREIINTINDLICKNFNMILRTLNEKMALNNRIYHIKFNVNLEKINVADANHLTFNFVETTTEMLVKYYSLLEIPEIKNKAKDIVIIELIHIYNKKKYGYSFYLEKAKN